MTSYKRFNVHIYIRTYVCLLISTYIYNKSKNYYSLYELAASLLLWIQKYTHIYIQYTILGTHQPFSPDILIKIVPEFMIFCSQIYINTRYVHAGRRARTNIYIKYFSNQFSHGCSGERTWLDYYSSRVFLLIGRLFEVRIAL